MQVEAWTVLMHWGFFFILFFFIVLLGLLLLLRLEPLPPVPHPETLADLLGDKRCDSISLDTLTHSQPT